MEMSRRDPISRETSDAGTSDALPRLPNVPAEPDRSSTESFGTAALFRTPTHSDQISPPDSSSTVLPVGNEHPTLPPQLDEASSDVSTPPLTHISSSNADSRNSPAGIYKLIILKCIGFFFWVYVAAFLVGLMMKAFPARHFEGLRLDKKKKPIPDKLFFPFSIYFQIVTATTVGYGDIVPLTREAKGFSCVISILGVGFLNHCISSFVAQTFDSLKIPIRYIVMIAFGIFVLGGVVIHFTEKLNFVDSAYLTIMSFTSIGHGDISFKSSSGRLFASAWLILATTAWNLLLPILPILIKRRNRDSEVQRNSNIDDLTAKIARLEKKNKKQSYVIEMLKRSRNIARDEIKTHCREFNRQFDAGRTQSPAIEIVIQS